jgi:hypothetical protein
MNDFIWCLPTTCPLCFRVVQHVRFEGGMRTLWCGCCITQDEWERVSSQGGSVTVTKSAEPTLCPWCKTWHIPGKGCSA